MTAMAGGPGIAAGGGGTKIPTLTLTSAAAGIAAMPVAKTMRKRADTLISL
jgi:hypothetical protein